MSKLLKSVIAGIIIFAAGLAITLVGVAVSGWKSPFAYAETEQFTAQTYAVQSAAITEIDADLDSGGINVEFYDGDNIEVEYYSSPHFTLSVKERGFCLDLRGRTRLWVVLGSVNIPATTVRLPKDKNYNLDLDLSAGQATIAAGNYGNIKAELGAGTLTFSGEVNCAMLEVDISAGKAEADGKLCCRMLEVDMSAGSFFAREADVAGELKIDNSAGKAEISRLTCPVMELDASAGDIKLNVVANKEEYTVEAERTSKHCNLLPQRGTDPLKRIEIDISAGDIEVNFIG